MGAADNGMEVQSGDWEDWRQVGDLRQHSVIFMAPPIIISE